MRAIIDRVRRAAARRSAGRRTTDWRWLQQHAGAQLFAEPAAGDFEECGRIAEAYRPVLARYAIAEQEFADGSIKDHDAAALHALVRARRPETCYQVGTFVGYSAMILASALKRNGHGRLVACDPEVPHRSLMNPVDVARDAARELGLEDVITFVRGWNAATMGDGFSQSYLRRIPVVGRATLEAMGPGLDFAFVDGDHSAAGTTCDLVLVQEFLKPDGVAVFHDVGSWPTVARALRSFLEDSFFYHAGGEVFFEYDTRDGADGLVALRCKGKSCYPLLQIEIVSATDGNPVPRALVRVLQTGFETITGTDGIAFHFGEVSANAEVAVSAAGFRDYRAEAGMATNGDFRSITIRLAPRDT